MQADLGFLFTDVIRCISHDIGIIFYKPKHEDPDGVYWLESIGMTMAIFYTD